MAKPTSEDTRSARFQSKPSPRLRGRGRHHSGCGEERRTLTPLPGRSDCDPGRGLLPAAGGGRFWTQTSTEGTPGPADDPSGAWRGHGRDRSPGQRLRLRGRKGRGCGGSSPPEARAIPEARSRKRRPEPRLPFRGARGRGPFLLLLSCWPAAGHKLVKSNRNRHEARELYLTLTATSRIVSSRE